MQSFRQAMVQPSTTQSMAAHHHTRGESEEKILPLHGGDGKTNDIVVTTEFSVRPMTAERL